MQKTIIALKGIPGSGKTTTIKKVNCLLRNQYEAQFIIDRKSLREIRVAMEIMDKRIRIGINSHGDISSRLRDQLESLIDCGCDIIVTAARTRIKTGDNGDEGKAVKRVEECAKKHGYIIEPVYRKQQPDSQKQAEEIVSLIKELLNS